MTTGKGRIMAILTNSSRSRSSQQRAAVPATVRMLSRMGSQSRFRGAAMVSGLRSTAGPSPTTSTWMEPLWRMSELITEP